MKYWQKPGWSENVALRREFGGETFRLWKIKKMKYHAKNEAKDLRRKGKNARIVKCKAGWAVYVR